MVHVVFPTWDYCTVLGVEFTNPQRCKCSFLSHLLMQTTNSLLHSHKVEVLDYYRHLKGNVFSGNYILFKSDLYVKHIFKHFLSVIYVIDNPKIFFLHTSHLGMTSLHKSTSIIYFLYSKFYILSLVLCNMDFLIYDLILICDVLILRSS